MNNKPNIISNSVTNFIKLKSTSTDSNSGNNKKSKKLFPTLILNHKKNVSYLFLNKSIKSEGGNKTSTFLESKCSIFDI